MLLADYEEKYARDHQDRRNILCHAFGIPLILGSLPLLFFRPLLALGLFAVGWCLQLVGHYFEGKKPSFSDDLTYLIIGPIYFARKVLRILTGRP